MKKKILIIAGVIILIVAIAMPILRNYTKSHSPATKADYSDNGLEIHVVYCQPFKKGRLIFGEESAKALQPYGKYWRVGANEATTFEVNKSIKLNGQDVKAGKYQLYAIPGKDVWKICLNTEWDRWGYAEANHSSDLFQTDIPADNNAPEAEQLNISFDAPDGNGQTQMVIHWDKTMVKVPIVSAP